MKAGYTIEHDKEKLSFVVVANLNNLNMVTHYSHFEKQRKEAGRIGIWQPKGTKDKNNSYIA